MAGRMSMYDKLKHRMQDEEGLMQGGKYGRVGGRMLDMLGIGPSDRTLGGEVKHTGVSQQEGELSQMGNRLDHMARNIDPSDPESVLQFQQMYNKMAGEGSQLKEDALFGPKSLAALRNLQGQVTPYRQTLIPSEQEEQGRKPSLLSLLGDRLKEGMGNFNAWNQKAGGWADQKFGGGSFDKWNQSLKDKAGSYQPNVMGLKRQTSSMLEGKPFDDWTQGMKDQAQERSDLRMDKLGYGEGQQYGKSYVDEKNRWHSGIESQMAKPSMENKSVNQQALTSMNNATTAIGDSGSIDPNINNFVTPGQEMDPGGKDWGGHENIKPELLLNKFGTTLDGDTGWQQDPNQVRMLQQSLTKSGYGDLLGPSGVDAKYGPATDTALRTYMATLQRGPSFEGPGF